MEYLQQIFFLFDQILFRFLSQFYNCYKVYRLYVFFLPSFCFHSMMADARILSQFFCLSLSNNNDTMHLVFCWFSYLWMILISGHSSFLLSLQLTLFRYRFQMDQDV